MGLTFLEYQGLAVRTSVAKDLKFVPSPFVGELPVPQGLVAKRLKTAALGLVGETGEFADLLKKVVGHDHNPDMVKFAKEGGDVFWYVAELSHALGIPLEPEDVDAAQLRAAEAMLGGPLGIEESPFDVAVEYALAAAAAAGRAALLYNALMIPEDADFHLMSIHLANVATHTAVALHLMGLKLSVVLGGNIDKLRQRYPDGFDTERSINRPAE